MFRVRKTAAASVVLILGFLFAAMVAPAHGATVLGSNFDGNMSVIYDSSSGNLFLENAPLPNPAVQQISIASTGGMLLPGNLNFPLLAPPVTVTSNTINLIDISWSSGNFLGTGSFLGNILGPSILQSTLLSDLTIDWTPASSSQVSGDLLYGTLGTTAGNPILPLVGADGFFRFFDVATGNFFDPPLADGFAYEMTGASLFTKVGFPLGFGDDFSILVADVPVATGLVGGDAFTFSGSGVPSFSVVGIDPDVDAALLDAFPLYLEFDTPTASFDMTAISAGVPEPSTLSLLVLGTIGLAFRRRQRGPTRRDGSA